MTLQDAVRAPALRWPLIVLMLVLAGLALWFIKSNALLYATYDPSVYGSFWPRRFGLVPHITGGVVAISAGLIQVWLGVTGRTRKLHRLLGRVYLGGVAIGSLGGFYLALTTEGSLAYASGLFFSPQPGR
jgi:hypothetical protein